MPDMEMTEIERSVLAAIPSRLLQKVQALAPPVRSFYRTVLSSFATAGLPPDPQALQRAAAESGVDASKTLADLTDLDILVASAGHDHRPAVRFAYPFSSEPTPHRVTLEGGPTVYSMCAIDALGIPAMLGRGGIVSSVEPETAAPIEVVFRDGKASWQPSGCVVLLGRAAECAHAADGICPFINFFTSPQAAKEWTARHPQVEVWHLDQDAALRLAVRSFGGLMTAAATQ